MVLGWKNNTNTLLPLLRPVGVLLVLKWRVDEWSLHINEQSMSAIMLKISSCGGSSISAG